MPLVDNTLLKLHNVQIKLRTDVLLFLTQFNIITVEAPSMASLGSLNKGGNNYYLYISLIGWLLSDYECVYMCTARHPLT